MAKMPRKSSDALFYVDEHGKKQDREIHEAWLAAGDEVEATMIGIAVARRIGLTEEEIQRLYSAPEK